MKKKWFAGLLLICCILCLNVLETKAENPTDNYEDFLSAIPDRVTAYIADNEEVFLSNSGDVNSLTLDSKEYIMGNPFIIYNFGEVQDEVYYYPVMDTDTGLAVWVVGIIGTEHGYVYEMKESMADRLNQIDDLDEKWIFYILAGHLYAENQNRILDIGESALPKEESLKRMAEENWFMALSYTEKLELITEKMQHFQPFSPVQWESEEEQLNSLLTTSLTLYSPQAQYENGMCWASATATIVNYLQSRVVTGFEVCNHVGIGYDAGGSIYDMQDGLSYYNISYNFIRSRALTWDELSANIDSKKPIALCAHGIYNGVVVGHAGVIFGYSGSGSSREIKVWNPYKNGAEVTISYNGIGSCFTIDGTVYGWDSSLSYE